MLNKGNNAPCMRVQWWIKKCDLDIG